jgi:hypothetical protein
MIIKHKNIVSILFLLVFLMPSIVKLEHHHENIHCNTGNETQYDNFHEKCLICSFEFSAFLDGIKTIELKKENPLIIFCNNYKSVNYSNHSQFSFLLRAPPSVRI